MFRRLHQRARNEHGFTLIELLVVILIIGILAAIALPTFLSQQSKGQDAASKSDARNLVSFVESCFTDTQAYSSCSTATQLGGPSGVTGLNVVTGTPAAGQVAVTASGTSTYTVTAASSSGNVYTISKAANGTITRDCGNPTAGTARGTGGCHAAADSSGNYW